jgi:hypothetical protein
VEKAVSETEREDDLRRTTKRRAALALGILKGETSISKAARKHAVALAEPEDLKERFLLAAENAFGTLLNDGGALREEQIKKLKQ